MTGSEARSDRGDPFSICDGGKLNYSDPWDIQTFYGSLVSDWMSTTLLNQVVRVAQCLIFQRIG